MPYLGNAPAEAYTSTVKNSFNGDGSTTDFTLSQPSTTNNLRVVVENVVQDPAVAYNVVNGSTLRFTSAPPVGTANIYAVHLGPATQTAVPPSEINNATTYTSDLTVQGAFTSQGIDDNADATAITIDSSERVGINTASPSAPLHVAADSSTLSLRISGRSSDDRSDIEFYENDNTTKIGAISTEAQSVNVIVTDSSGVLSLTADTTRMRNASGTEIARFLSTGGITFNGDTAAANALDDYEEGTWTPACSTGTLTYSRPIYTKIGRSVTVSANVGLFTDTTSSSAITITGLPFTSSSSQFATGAIFARYVSKTETNAAFISDASSSLVFYPVTSGNWAALKHSELASGAAYIYFTVTYTTS